MAPQPWDPCIVYLLYTLLMCKDMSAVHGLGLYVSRVVWMLGLFVGFTAWDLRIYDLGFTVWG